MKTCLHVKNFVILLLLLSSPVFAVQAWGGEDFVKITDLHYKNWINDTPKTLIPEFEKACRAVEDYLKSQNKDFSGDDCVSQLFVATLFIANINDGLDANSPVDAQFNEKIIQVKNRYNRVVEEVIEKAIQDKKAESQKENANLIYTVVVTIAKDVFADYFHNVIDNPEIAKSDLLLAGEEDGRRHRRDGEYKEIYSQLGSN